MRETAAQFERPILLFSGGVINVSGWKDEDKEGGRYRDYFPHATEYSISNWSTEVRGYQALDGEILLNLEAPLPDALKHRFDVVLNHTTLEHVFDVFTAFRNLCELSRDVVIVVVPFAQEHHPADFGDFWRFTPQALERLFDENGFGLLYLSGMNEWNAASYVVGVAAREPQRWRDRLPDPRRPERLGSAHVRNGLAWRLLGKLRSLRR